MSSCQLWGQILQVSRDFQNMFLFFVCCCLMYRCNQYNLAKTCFIDSGGGRKWDTEMLSGNRWTNSVRKLKSKNLYFSLPRILHHAFIPFPWSIYQNFNWPKKINWHWIYFEMKIWSLVLSWFQLWREQYKFWQGQRPDFCLL